MGILDNLYLGVPEQNAPAYGNGSWGGVSQSPAASGNAATYAGFLDQLGMSGQIDPYATSTKQATSAQYQTQSGSGSTSLDAEQRLTREQWLQLLSANPELFRVVDQYKSGGTSGEMGDVAQTLGTLLYSGRPVGQYIDGRALIQDDMPDGLGGSQFTSFYAPVQMNEDGALTSADVSNVDFRAGTRQNRGNEFGWMAAPFLAGGIAAGAGAAGAGAAGGTAAGGTAAGLTEAELAAMAAAGDAGGFPAVAAAGGGTAAAGGAAAGGGLLSSSAPAAATAGGGLTGASLLSGAQTAAGALNSPLGAAALGALAGASGSGPQTTTSSTSLPAYLQPYAEQ